MAFILRFFIYILLAGYIQTDFIQPGLH